MLTGKNILLGITGGIAAYKICELIRMYKKQGANVQIVATKNALNFVTKLTLQTLSQNDIAIDEFSIKNYVPKHISFADKFDIFVIAPATANTISKIATGVCDNLLTSIACAWTKQIIFATAMNCNMWENPSVKKNIQLLKSRGYEILEPETGFLACGYNAKGRLCKIERIFDKTIDELKYENLLEGKKVIITSGGTREKIDSARYISNFSSGKMGCALYQQALKMGADAKLITTQNVENAVIVSSAIEMQEAVEKEFLNADADILIMAAAVADYRAKETVDYKMKKTCEDEISITLVKNPDILKGICEKKKSNQIVVGFCAESDDLIKNAQAKIQQKGCDFLVANDISRKDIGFSSDYNEVHILDKFGNIKQIPRENKQLIAKQILEAICK